jgi:predicted  nucleic acid-binding Zn-ribbon protein
LRKIKKDQPYPTIVIIPYGKAKDAWRFQESMINVWYWKAKVGWKCKRCDASFTTASSLMPSKCEKCSMNTQFEYEGVEPNDVEFIEDSNNPAMTFGEMQDELRRRDVGPSDMEALKQFRAFLDRPALHQPFREEGNMNDFLAALDSVIRALNTGILKTREGDEIARTKPRAMFSNPKWKKALEELTSRFEELRTRFQRAVRNKEMILRKDGFYAFYPNHNLPSEIDAMRESITLLFNELLKEAGLEPIISVRDFGYSRRWHL